MSADPRCGKATHPTHRDARAVLRLMLKEGIKGRMLCNERLMVYYCRRCVGWHIGGAQDARHIRRRKRTPRSTRGRL